MKQREGRRRNFFCALLFVQTSARTKRSSTRPLGLYFLVGVFIVVILHMAQQYIVLPFTLTARVLTLVFCAVIGIDMPIFWQAGHITPAVLAAIGFLAVDAAITPDSNAPKLKAHTVKATNLFIIFSLETKRFLVSCITRIIT